MEIIGAFLPCCIGTLALLLLCKVTSATTFTIANGCSYTVWPGILPNAGSSILANGGFELPSGQSVSIHAPVGWSGRLWGRTGCEFSSSGMGTCASGDCGGKLQCEGTGAATPATLAEFSIAGTQGNVKQDFYDVSLVDGYNIPIAVLPTSGYGSCGAAGCARDLNMNCPAELQVVEQDVGDGRSSVVGCKSACDAFGQAEYCCSGSYANPSTCKPSIYSEMFKSACPKAYSYAFDDPTSTFTCTKADYEILFCPTSSSSQKSGAGFQQSGGNVIGAQAYATPSSSHSQDTARPSSYLILVAAYVASILARL